MTKKTSKTDQKEEIDKKWLTALAVMGIVGIVLFISGAYAIFEISLLLGLILLLLGILTYVGFVLIERRLKLL